MVKKGYLISHLCLDFNDSFNMPAIFDTLHDELVGPSDQNVMMANSGYSVEYPSRMPMSPMANTDVVSSFYKWR